MTCTIPEFLFTATAIAFVCLSVVGAWQSISLVTLLRLRHPVTWNILGRPDGTSNADSASNATSLIRFLWRREYRELDDPKLSVVCESCRKGMVLSILAVALAVGCLLVTPSIERALWLQCWRTA
jgi:hypothetical protein